MTATKTLPGAVRLRVAPSPTGDPHVGTAYMLSLIHTSMCIRDSSQTMW